jgi:hypothetical protein
MRAARLWRKRGRLPGTGRGLDATIDSLEPEGSGLGCEPGAGRGTGAI